MLNTISLTEARKKIFSLAEEVQSPNTFYLLTERGKPKAALLSADDLESILETLEVIKDFPELERETKDAMDDFYAGNYWILNDSPKKK